MIDFVFALVHYCVYNDYKITKCAHCGKLFITKKGKKNGEEKYCCRNSPFAGYEEYPCKKAVKAIKDMLDKKRISEYERLRNRAKEFSLIRHLMRMALLMLCQKWQIEFQAELVYKKMMSKY